MQVAIESYGAQYFEMLFGQSFNIFILLYLTKRKSSGAQKVAKIDSEDATVQRVNAEVGSAHALLLDVNVILIFVGIAGLGNEFHNVTYPMS